MDSQFKPLILALLCIVIVHGLLVDNFRGIQRMWRKR